MWENMRIFIKRNKVQLHSIPHNYDLNWIYILSIVQKHGRGQEIFKKSLPVVLKNYKEQKPKAVKK